ncbi:MAG: CPBP family intramembrane glutamic endopeptidase [Candidatus Hodarchaeota archaeon]
MSKDNEKKIKYCVYCGSDVGKSETYCPNCGKLIIKLKNGKIITEPHIFHKPVSVKEAGISRKCPGCGSIITSTIINQCPICNTQLEKVSEGKKAVIQKKPGLIFTDKKLEPEEQFLLKKDTWNFKEGINVFGTCIYVLIISFFLIFTIISFQIDLSSSPINIQLILLSQIAEILFGLYPIWYIYRKKHSFNKLGFYFDSKKILISILIGIFGTFLLVLIEFFSDSIITFFYDIGLDILNVRLNIDQQNDLIRTADLLWIVLLTLTLCIGAVSSEIVFRGVLHNTLKRRIRNEVYVILIVALAYSLLMLLFSFPVGMSFIFANFLSFTALGVLYSINGNLFNTIIANIAYNIVVVILIILYIL